MFLVPMTRHTSGLARNFERFFDDGFDRLLAPAAEGLRSPALDVAESDQAYTVKIDLPGVGKEDVKIAIDGRRVTVEAQTRKADEKKEGDRIVYRERSLASYSRRFNLAQEVDQAESAAQMDQGVLTLTLAKRRANAATQLTVK